MIRCDHCGWSNNPDDAKKCQKCNQELVVMPPVPDGGKIDSVKVVGSECPRCGYPVSGENPFCPNCGTAVGAPSAPATDPSMKRTVRDLPSEMKAGADISADMKQTMRDVRNDVRGNANISTLKETSAENVQTSSQTSFRLRPIDADVPGAYAFGADTDAAFEFADGQWYISDNGGSGSVYVRASRRIMLQKGDVVIIGGRRYSFE